jgi:phosphoinositide-3-kinase, regulatory subunit 4
MHISIRWIAYQLLRGLAACHSAGVCHGDIQSENVLVTSWSWVLLCDFAPFKPAYLPDDQPAEVNYYFHVSTILKYTVPSTSV